MSKRTLEDDELVEEFRHAVEYLGGPEAVAKRLTIPLSRLCTWCNGNKAHPDMMEVVETAADPAVRAEIDGKRKTPRQQALASTKQVVMVPARPADAFLVIQEECVDWTLSHWRAFAVLVASHIDELEAEED